MIEQHLGFICSQFTYGSQILLLLIYLGEVSKGQVHCGDNVIALTFPLVLADVYMQLTPTHTKVD